MKKILLSALCVLALSTSAVAQQNTSDYSGITANPEFDRYGIRPNGDKVELFYYEACNGQVYFYTNEKITSNTTKRLSLFEPKRASPFNIIAGEFFSSQKFRNKVCAKIPTLNPKLKTASTGVYIKAKVPPMPSNK